MATLLTLLRTRLSVRMFILRSRFKMIRFALTAMPIAGGAPDGDGGDADADKDSDKDAKPSGDADDDQDDDSSDDDAQDDDDDAKPKEPDWKRMARKHERESKKARKELDDARKRLKDREDADKTEQEKAVEEAEKRGRESSLAEHEKERRQDRLELASTRIAAKGLTIGTGDDAKTVKFADPDDALVHLERDIRNGELDPDDIFDQNGKVRSDQLEEALVDLLSRKPHLAASEKTPKAAGSADAGKGAPAKTDTSVEDHLTHIRRNKPARAA